MGETKDKIHIILHKFSYWHIKNYSPHLVRFAIYLIALP